ncbi:hypothetical protein EJ08DRAFT_701831 [Tothia fuscella]|uniref:Uncharacterized protein n=1 Tax=Tothia fuscella TaxID=1048955 RepID=A0A9P4NHG9_9PEZI|nr:hypothetical protein EJ08DRAFT_701831 [Tothia fuscella]
MLSSLEKFIEEIFVMLFIVSAITFYRWHCMREEGCAAIAAPCNPAVEQTKEKDTSNLGDDYSHSNTNEVDLDAPASLPMTIPQFQTNSANEDGNRLEFANIDVIIAEVKEEAHRADSTYSSESHSSPSSSVSGSSLRQENVNDIPTFVLNIPPIDDLRADPSAIITTTYSELSSYIESMEIADVAQLKSHREAFEAEKAAFEEEKAVINDFTNMVEGHCDAANAELSRIKKELRDEVTAKDETIAHLTNVCEVLGKSHTEANQKIREGQDDLELALGEICRGDGVQDELRKALEDMEVQNAVLSEKLQVKDQENEQLADSCEILVKSHGEANEKIRAGQDNLEQALAEIRHGRVLQEETQKVLVGLKAQQDQMVKELGFKDEEKKLALGAYGVLREFHIEAEEKIRATEGELGIAWEEVQGAREELGQARNEIQVINGKLNRSNNHVQTSKDELNGARKEVQQIQSTLDTLRVALAKSLAEHVELEYHASDLSQQLVNTQNELKKQKQVNKTLQPHHVVVEDLTKQIGEVIRLRDVNAGLQQAMDKLENANVDLKSRLEKSEADLKDANFQTRYQRGQAEFYLDKLLTPDASDAVLARSAAKDIFAMGTPAFDHKIANATTIAAVPDIVVTAAPTTTRTATPGPLPQVLLAAADAVSPMVQNSRTMTKGLQAAKKPFTTAEMKDWSAELKTMRIRSEKTLARSRAMRAKHEVPVKPTTASDVEDDETFNLEVKDTPARSRASLAKYAHSAAKVVALKGPAASNAVRADPSNVIPRARAWLAKYTIPAEEASSTKAVVKSVITAPVLLHDNKENESVHSNSPDLSPSDAILSVASKRPFTRSPLTAVPAPEASKEGSRSVTPGSDLGAYWDVPITPPSSPETVAHNSPPRPPSHLDLRTPNGLADPLDRLPLVLSPMKTAARERENAIIRHMEDAAKAALTLGEDKDGNIIPEELLLMEETLKANEALIPPEAIIPLPLSPPIHNTAAYTTPMKSTQDESLIPPTPKEIADMAELMLALTKDDHESPKKLVQLEAVYNVAVKAIPTEVIPALACALPPVTPKEIISLNLDLLAWTDKENDHRSPEKLGYLVDALRVSEAATPPECTPTPARFAAKPKVSFESSPRMKVSLKNTPIPKLLPKFSGIPKMPRMSSPTKKVMRKLPPIPEASPRSPLSPRDLSKLPNKTLSRLGGARYMKQF